MRIGSLFSTIVYHCLESIMPQHSFISSFVYHCQESQTCKSKAHKGFFQYICFPLT